MSSIPKITKYVCDAFISEYLEYTNELCSQDLSRRTVYEWRPTWKNPFEFISEKQVLRWVPNYGEYLLPVAKQYYKKWVKDEPYIPMELKPNYEEIV